MSKTTIRVGELMQSYYDAIASTHGHQPHWLDIVVRPLCETLALAENRMLRLLGPSGLACDVLVDLYLSWDGDDVKSLVLRPEGLGTSAPTLAVVDFSHIALDYPRESIGRLNGLHFLTEPVPRDEDPIPFLQERLRAVTIRRKRRAN